MTLLVRCKCGKKLKIDAAHAGRKVICPNCKHPYRISPEKFHAAAGNTRKPNPGPKRPAAPQPIGPRTPPEEPVELDLMSATLDGATGALLTDLEAEATTAAAFNAPLVVEIDSALELGYAAADAPPAKETLPGDAIQPVKRGFWADMALAFIYPFASVTNAVNTLVILVVNVVAGFFCLGFVVHLWMASVYMNVVGDTAAGSDDFNGPTIEGGLFDAIVVPFFRFLGAFALALSPNILYTGMIFVGAVPQDPYAHMTMSALGVFMLPMFILLASLSAWQALFHPQKMFLTIAKTLLPYLAIWIALGVAFFLLIMSSVAETQLTKIGLAASGLGSKLLGVMGAQIVGICLYVYLMVVGMRFIGMYYRHFKHRFAFTLE